MKMGFCREPEERQPSTSESSYADSRSSSRNARSIPRRLIPMRGDGNCQVRPNNPKYPPLASMLTVCADVGVAARSHRD